MFDRYDRSITARGRGEPLDGITDHDRLEDLLFRVALFLVDSPDVTVAVAGPAGRPHLREVSTYMDRRRTRYHSMRYRYGVTAGRYTVAITGLEQTDYNLEVFAADRSCSLAADGTMTSIGTGESHVYRITIPKAAGGDADLERRRQSIPPLMVGLADAGVGGAGIGTYRLGRRQNRSKPGEESYQAEDPAC